MGTIQQPSITEDINFYNNMDVNILHGFTKIDSFLQSKYAAQETLAIRDYYPWFVVLLTSLTRLGGLHKERDSTLESYFLLEMNTKTPIAHVFCNSSLMITYG